MIDGVALIDGVESESAHHAEEERSRLKARVQKLTPTAGAGTNGLTILSRNLKTQDETQMVDYVVRNDTHQTLDEISSDSQYLDKDGTQWNVTWSYGHVIPTGKTATPCCHQTGNQD